MSASHREPEQPAAEAARSVARQIEAGPSPAALGFAEALGTYLLVLLGCGAVHSAVLTQSQSGLWQVAIVWGVAVMLAVFVAGGISGAHVNPAITLAMAAWNRCPRRLVPIYVAGQMAGAFAAAATLFVLYGGLLSAKEAEKAVVRGGPGSHLTAMCYGEYFPSPGPLAAAAGTYDDRAWEKFSTSVSHLGAFLAEVAATAVLALVVFAVTDLRNRAAPGTRLAPVIIGLTVAALISIVGPLTQACLNPARDFGPRLFAWSAGWGSAAIPGPNGLGCVTVYILAPVLGALGGASLYEMAVGPHARGPSCGSD